MRAPVNQFTSKLQSSITKAVGQLGPTVFATVNWLNVAEYVEM
jgi:hypothetical protein